jgi:hypothetical protein
MRKTETQCGNENKSRNENFNRTNQQYVTVTLEIVDLNSQQPARGTAKRSSLFVFEFPIVQFYFIKNDKHTHEKSSRTGRETSQQQHQHQHPPPPERTLCFEAGEVI